MRFQQHYAPTLMMRTPSWYSGRHIAAIIRYKGVGPPLSIGGSPFQRAPELHSNCVRPEAEFFYVALPYNDVTHCPLKAGGTSLLIPSS